MNLNKVWEIKPLKMPRENEARDILDKVAKQVQPIMRNRRWKVNLLSEFWQNNEWDFFPYEQILDTMLHELCHNQYGPHNAYFYNLLDDIRKECEQLMSKGITGIDLRGKRLGGQPPLSSFRQKALAAAETRVQRGPYCLLAQNVLVEEPSGTSHTPVVPQIISCGESTPVSNDEKQEANASWQCGACTLLNKPSSLTCEACETQRIDVNNANTNTTTNTNMWSCKFCTLQNPVATERCLACGGWKYSYGPPTATCGPYLGT